MKSAEFVYSSAIQNLRNILSGKKIEIISDHENDIEEIHKNSFLLPFLNSKNELNNVPNIEYFNSSSENGNNNGKKKKKKIYSLPVLLYIIMYIL